MRIDPAVSRAKYAEAIRHLDAQAETLRQRGCWVQRMSYPEVDVVFLPRAPLRVSVPVVQASELILRPGSAKATLMPISLGALAGRAFGVRVLMDDYDQRAPSITFRDPWTWAPLAHGEIPIGYTVDETGKAQLVRLDEHPETKQPFLCLRGTREYHEHPQHTGDDWMLYRAGASLFDLLSQVWLTCVQQAHPNILFLPQKGLPLSWEPSSPTQR
jgi:Predicted metal binding domain